MHILRAELLTGWTIQGDYYHSFGWYHLVWLALCILATIFIVKRFAVKHDEKTDNRVLLTLGLILLATEIYKQLFYLKMYDGQYAWWVLPFQFCDVPVYVMVAVPFFKPGKIKNALLSYLGYYGLLAGVAAMAYPESMLTTHYITLLIQTMLWHSLMVVAGVYVAVSKGFGKHLLSETLPGFFLFLAITAFAVLMNETVGKNLPGFNLFYLSFRDGSSLPILSGFYHPGEGVLKWLLLILGYVAAFAIGTVAEFFVFRLIRRLRKADRVPDCG